MRTSVCLSISLPTLMSHAETVQYIEVRFATNRRTTHLFLRPNFAISKFKGSSRMSALKTGIAIPFTSFNNILRFARFIFLVKLCVCQVFNKEMLTFLLTVDSENWTNNTRYMNCKWNRCEIGCNVQARCGLLRSLSFRMSTKP